MFTPERGTSVNISKQAIGSLCKVCSGVERKCEESLLLKGDNPVWVEFTCAQPENVFRVEIIRKIECTTKSCDGDIMQVDSDVNRWLDFHRRLTWNLKASLSKSVRVDFIRFGSGMRQIPPSENCPDMRTYTLKTSKKTGTAVVGKFCKSGFIRSAQVLNEGSFSLDVPPSVLVIQSDRFAVSVGENIKSLAKITLSLPHGTSAELLSPNFPESFPDDGKMEWYFELTAEQRAAVEFLELTEPPCFKKETAVKYRGGGGGRTLERRLTDTQPLQSQGNFSLILSNCEIDRRRHASPGLSLKLKVTSSMPPVLCSVDMKKFKGFSLQLERLKLSSKCEMKINSVIMEKITVASGNVSQLSFQDCNPGDITVTANRVIGCSHMKDCPKSSVPLAAPSLPDCLPSDLDAVTWSLRPPPKGTVELTSLIGPLEQSLSGDLCHDSVVTLTEDNGATLGHFCPQGAITKVQIHESHVSVKVTRADGQALISSAKAVFAARLKEEISERYIFTVTPKKDSSLLLATPGWPAGMASYATVSWIVLLPPKTEAHLEFISLSQPKCESRHTNIRVQTFNSLEEDYSRREDEEADQISVYQSFYLNMSNCMPERGDFSVITKLTIQKNQVLIIIASVVAALVLLFVAVLVAVCFIIRKKKKKLNHLVSIYNPDGTNFQPGPGHNGFPKSREDNESHVYASIEDSLVYTHLLRKGAEMGIYTESDPYEPVTVQADSLASKDANNMETGVYQEYPVSAQQAPPLPNRPPSNSNALVDNVIYEGRPQLEEHSTKMEARLEPEGGD
ncbi:CUB domain-containing protein 1-like isoform X2 [Festucalex cinctus]